MNTWQLLERKRPWKGAFWHVERRRKDCTVTICVRGAQCLWAAGSGRLGSGAVDEMGPRISHQPSWTTNQFISAGASSRKPSSVLAPPTVTSCPLLHLWITLITSNLEFQPKGKPAAKILLGGEHFLSLHPLSRLPLRTAIIPAIMRPECPYLLCSGRRGDRCLPSSLREQTPCLWPGPHPSPGPQPHLPAF